MTNRNLGLNGLIPEGRGTIEMHFRDAVPEGWFNEVHFEVLFSTGAPTPGIVAIEAREGNFRQFACRIGKAMRVKQRGRGGG